MTIGEISRSLARLEVSQHEQIEKLDEIKSQTVKTNGFVGRHEERLNSLDREVRDLKVARRGQHVLRRSTDSAEAITVSIPANKKIFVMLIAAVGGIVAAAFMAALKLWGLA